VLGGVLGGVHTELRWRIELPALHMVFENNMASIRQRAELSVGEREIGSRPKLIDPHSE